MNEYNNIDNNSIREKILEDLINERKQRIKNNYTKQKTKKTANLVTSNTYKYYFVKEKELKIDDNVSLKIDKDEILKYASDSDNNVMHITLTINEEEYKGEISKNKETHTNYTTWETDCPYKVTIFPFNKSIIDETNIDTYIRVIIIEQEKHQELSNSIVEEDLNKFEKIATELINNAKKYEDEERILIITNTTCKKYNIDIEPYEDILEKIFEKSKFGKDVMNDNIIPDDNTGNEKLDKEKREINILKEEILRDIEKLENKEIEYQKELLLHNIDKRLDNLN